MKRRIPRIIHSTRLTTVVLTCVLSFSGTSIRAFGDPQQSPPPFDGGGPPRGDHPPPPSGPGERHRPPGEHGGPMDRSMHVGPPGRWWNDPGMAQRIGLSSTQQQRMNEIFDQARPRLIDLSATLQKQQALLDPLLRTDPIDDAKVLAQIDRIVQARGALERTNSAMLLALRKALTAEQWQRLQADDPSNRPQH